MSSEREMTQAQTCEYGHPCRCEFDGPLQLSSGCCVHGEMPCAGGGAEVVKEAEERTGLIAYAARWIEIRGVAGADTVANAEALGLVRRLLSALREAQQERERLRSDVNSWSPDGYECMETPHLGEEFWGSRCGHCPGCYLDRFVKGGTV